MRSIKPLASELREPAQGQRGTHEKGWKQRGGRPVAYRRPPGPGFRAMLRLPFKAAPLPTNTAQRLRQEDKDKALLLVCSIIAYVPV